MPIVRAIPPVVIAEKVIAGLQSKPTETHVRRIEERPARYGDWPEALDERLVSALEKRGIERPYTHQAEAIANALAGKNTVVVTPTASGKTLCYNLPVLADDPRATRRRGRSTSSRRRRSRRTSSTSCTAS